MASSGTTKRSAGSRPAAACAGVDGGAVFGVGGGGRKGDFGARADARIGVAGLDEAFNGFLIKREARGLIDRTFIPRQAKPSKVVDGLVVGALFDARAIEVFDAEKGGPVVFSGEEIIDEKGSG